MFDVHGAVGYAMVSSLWIHTTEAVWSTLKGEGGGEIMFWLSGSIVSTLYSTEY